MSIDVLEVGENIFNKILASWIQERIKIIYHNQIWVCSKLQTWFSSQTLMNIIHYINTQGQNVMCTSQWCRKAFWWNPASLHDKGPEETKNIRNISLHNKGYLWETYSQHILNPLKSGTRYMCPLCSFLLNIVLEILPRTITEERKTKGIQIGKEVEVLLFVDNLTCYVKDPKIPPIKPF